LITKQSRKKSTTCKLIIKTARTELPVAI